MTTTRQAVPTWTLGDRLRKARHLAGIDSADMARDIGRTRRTIANYENDTTVAPLLVVRQYAARTGVPVEWLLASGLDPQMPTSLNNSECYPGLTPAQAA